MMLGDPDFWLDHFRGLQLQLNDAIEAVWPGCVLPLLVEGGAAPMEDRITNQLVNALIRAKRVPGLFMTRPSLLTDDTAGLVKELGEIDFILTIGDRENVYLGCECKRIYVPYVGRTQSQFSDYIQKGLRKFLIDQYSSGLPLAVMVGYIMDGRGQAAVAGLAAALTRKSESLRMTSAVDAGNTPVGSLRLRTSHLTDRGTHLELHHTLLNWPAFNPKHARS